MATPKQGQSKPKTDFDANLHSTVNAVNVERSKRFQNLEQFVTGFSGASFRTRFRSFSWDENLQFWFPKNNLSQVSHIFFSSFFVSSYLLIKPWGTLSSVLSKWIFAALEERLPSKYPVLWAISRGQSGRRSWHHRNLGHVADVTHRKASSGVLSPPLRYCCSHLFRWSVCGEVFAHCTHCWSVEHRMA